MIYAKKKKYEKTARQINLDRRTVKKKVDLELLDELIKRGFPR